MSFEWNSIRQGGPAHGIVTQTVHKTLPGGGRGQGGGGWGVQEWWGTRDGRVKSGGALGVVDVKG